MGCAASSDAKPAEAEAGQPADGQGRPPEAQGQAEAAKIVVERKALPERTAAEIEEIVAKIEAALAEDPDSLRVLGQAESTYNAPHEWTWTTPHSASAFYNALRPLEPGGEAPMAVLKSSYVRQLGKELKEAKKIEEPQRRAEAVAKLAITYRQAMPKDAFMTPEEVEEQSKKIDPFYRRLAAAGIRYCWDLPTHPE